MKMQILCLLATIPHIRTAQEFVAPQSPRREISTQAPEINASILGMIKFFLSSQKPWLELTLGVSAEYGNIKKIQRPPHAAARSIIRPNWRSKQLPYCQRKSFC